jgi:hypothetical protein
MITDDWYLNPIWRDRVLTSPLGKTVIRNGMLAYALFQGWGNDPVAFEAGERKQLTSSWDWIKTRGWLGRTRR